MLSCLTDDIKADGSCIAPDASADEEWPYMDADVLFTVKLECIGRARGTIFLTGGPNKPGECTGGFQEAGVVVYSADGKRWEPLKFWDCDQNRCPTKGLAGAIDHDFDSHALGIDLPSGVDIQYAHPCTRVCPCEEPTRLVARCTPRTLSLSLFACVFACQSAVQRCA